MNISKKTGIILILAGVLLLIGIFLYFYISPSGSTGVTTTSTTTSKTPFGDTSKPSVTTPDVTDKFGTSTQTASDSKAETLRQIFSEPVSGSVVFTKNKDSVVRFVERSNANIYEIRKDSSQVIRLTNKTIPKIQEAIFDKAGNSLVFRYLDENKIDQIDSFTAKIKLSTSTSNEFFGDITGTFLPVNIPALVTNPSSGKIAYLQNKLTGDGKYIYTANSDGSGKTQIADIPLSEINISWPKENTIAVITKPSSKYAGFLYFINTGDGIMRKIMGDVWGLNTMVNLAANKIVYSKIVRSEPVISYYDITTNTNSNLQIKTLSDKCVWGKLDSQVIYCAVPSSLPAGEYPDNWYQGLVSFSDNIWKIDLETGKSTIIYDIVADSLSIDAMSLSISDKDDFLVFTNKTDLSLWGLIMK